MTQYFKYGVLALGALILAGCAGPKLGGTEIVEQPRDRYEERRSNRTPVSVMADAAAAISALRLEDPVFEEKLAEAHGLLVFPKTVRIGALFSGQQGPGVLMSRDTETGLWSDPVFQWYRNLTYGLQVGLQQSDLVMVITQHSTYTFVVEGNFTLNFDAIATSGTETVGQQWSTLDLKGGVWVAVRAHRGLFAGIGGGAGDIRYDRFWTGQYYDDFDVGVLDILARTDHPSPEDALQP